MGHVLLACMRMQEQRDAACPAANAPVSRAICGYAPHSDGTKPTPDHHSCQLKPPKRKQLEQVRLFLALSAKLQKSQNKKKSS